MKRNIVLEHRQALDAVERATSKYSGCRRRGTCSDKAECLECPAYIEQKRCEAVLDEKSATLKQLNEQIVVQNDAFALRQREDSLQKRMQREEKRELRMQTPPKSRITVEQAEKLQLQKEGLPVTMTPKTNKPVITPKYNRNELTAERYLAHKKNERLSDATILALYGIPKSSFEKWKRNNKITNKPIALYDAKAATEVISLQQKLDKLEGEHASLKVSHNQLHHKLATAQDINKMRQEMIVSLEKDLQEAQVAPEPQIADTACGEIVPDYEAMFKNEHAIRETLESQAKEYEQLFHDEALAFESYRKEIEALIYKRDEQDEEVVDAFNVQLKVFERYETLLLERILCLKKK